MYLNYTQQDAGEGTSAGTAASTSAVAVQSNMSEKDEDNNNIFHDILLKYLDKKAPILGEWTRVHSPRIGAFLSRYLSRIS